MFVAFTETQTKKGVISKIYKLLKKTLQNESEDNNLRVREKWELGADIIITDEKWEDSFKAGQIVQCGGSLTGT